MKLLLSHDAPIDDADQSGRTPLMMAAERGKATVLGAKMFNWSYGSTLSCFCILSITPSSSPVSYFSYSVAELLLTSASTSQTDKDGNTALHLACSNVSVTLRLMSRSCVV